MDFQIPLPPAHLRWGSHQFADDAIYIASAINNAKLLENTCGITEDCSVLDIGCGQARVLYGLIARLGSVRRYVGIDVHKPSIDWLDMNIKTKMKNTSFYYIPYKNERYNPDGSRTLDTSLDEEFDRITLFSVFSHMKIEDIRVYLPFIRSHLKKNGKVFVTLFVEDNVDDQMENPPGYRRRWNGALHCVRINRQTFEHIILESGFRISQFIYGNYTDGQSSYSLIPA